MELASSLISYGRDPSISESQPRHSSRGLTAVAIRSRRNRSISFGRTSGAAIPYGFRMIGFRFRKLFDYLVGGTGFEPVTPAV